MEDTRVVSYVDRIIAKFGRSVDLARALGHQNPTTVQGWRERGVIPARQQPVVLAAARQMGIDLNPADFFTADHQSSHQLGDAA